MFLCAMSLTVCDSERQNTEEGDETLQYLSAGLHCLTVTWLRLLRHGALPASNELLYFSKHS